MSLDQIKIVSPFVPTTDGGRFPVRRIFCIGKNYAEHVKEMGGNPADTSPVFFTKPADAVVCPTAENPFVAYASRTENLHYEGELVMALKSGGKQIAEDEALTHLYGLALGSDMTRRDLQFAMKEKGAPWDIAKGFDQSAVIGPIAPMSTIPLGLSYTLSLNGEVRQQAKLSDMIFPPARILAELSTYFELKGGDLIFSGTPEGVGAVVPGDVVEIASPEIPDLRFEMA